jgi:hypothetical protein
MDNTSPGEEPLNLIDQATALKALAPHLPALHEIITSAFSDATTLISSNPAVSARSKAALVNDFMRYRVKDRFNYGRVDGANLSLAHGVPWLSIDNLLLVRFKMLNGKYLPSNIRTKHQVELDLQLKLLDLPDYTRVVAGYRKTSHGDCGDIAVCCVVDSDLKWRVVVPPPAPRSGNMLKVDIGPDLGPIVAPRSVDKGLLLSEEDIGKAEPD